MAVWQALGPGAFAFFHPHTGFAKGPLGGTYEEMLCVDLAGESQLGNASLRDATRHSMHYIMPEAAANWH